MVYLSYSQPTESDEDMNPSTKALLKYAEKVEVWMHKRPYNTQAYEAEVAKKKSYLSPKIIDEERYRPFFFKELEMYGQGEPPEQLLSLGERNQLLMSILDDIYMDKTMPQTHAIITRELKNDP